MEARWKRRPPAPSFPATPSSTPRRQRRRQADPRGWRLVKSSDAAQIDGVTALAMASERAAQPAYAPKFLGFTYPRHRAGATIGRMKDMEFWKHEISRELMRQREFEADAGDGITRRSVQVERFAFVTAYMTRKLIEAVALTEDVTEHSWAVTQFPCVVAPPHRRWFRLWDKPGGHSWQPLEDHYDFDAPTTARVALEELCNYLIHHFAFDVRRDDDTGEITILFNSDRTKDKWLLSMPLDDFKRVLDEVRYDEVRWVHMDRHSGVVIQRRSRPPGEI